MSAAHQEFVALAIVAFAFASVAWGVFRARLAQPLSRWLLSRGQVKWAMRLRGVGAKDSGCGSCESGGGC